MHIFWKKSLIFLSKRKTILSWLSNFKSNHWNIISLVLLYMNWTPVIIVVDIPSINIWEKRRDILRPYCLFVIVFLCGDKWYSVFVRMEGQWDFLKIVSKSNRKETRIEMRPIYISSSRNVRFWNLSCNIP